MRSVGAVANAELERSSASDSKAERLIDVLEIGDSQPQPKSGQIASDEKGQ